MNMQPDRYATRTLLKADAARHSELLGTPLRHGARLWIGMLAPRFAPVLLYRLAYACSAAGWQGLGRLISMVNFVIFGIEIALNCKIGPGLFFPHTQGTVLGAMSIGSNATIYQGVTIGAKGLDFSYTHEHRPVIGDCVVIGAGAKVLGGVSLGNNTVVGANAVVITSFTEGTTVAGIPAKALERKDPIDEI